MTYKECKNQSLRIVFQQSVAGSEIPLPYNCQEDYVNQIPGLINQAQTYLVAFKRIPAMYALDEPDDQTLFPNSDVYTLPDNFLQLMDGGLIDANHPGKADRFKGYSLIGRNKLVVPKGMKGLVAEYYRTPNKLSDKPKDTDQLDNTPDVQAIVPVYVAAQLVMYDDYFRHATLWNEVEAMVGRLKEPMTAEWFPVMDAYNGFDVAVI